MFRQYFVALLFSSTSAHTIFQRLKVDNVDQGQLVGIRVPTSDYPVYDVTSADIACNKGYSQPVSSKVVEVKAGSAVGAMWGHVIGGAQTPGDKDNPIAASHHGPVITYLAKVDSAASAQPSSSLKWFKIQEEGMASDGTWAIDRMYKAGGWFDVQIPSCIAPGEYLMRHEVIALHGANKMNQAQFYMGCAQIKITGSGSLSPSNTVSFPGAYKANDPGIFVNIYEDKTGKPNMGGKPYIIPGPAVVKC